MRVVLVAVNTVAALFSLIWIWGHSSTPANDWEFWFALGYLLVAGLNLFYFVRRARKEGMYGNEEEEEA